MIHSQKKVDKKNTFWRTEAKKGVPELFHSVQQIIPT